MREKLTKAQELMLGFINRYIQDKSFPPTMAEIAKGMNYRSANSVKEGLDILERKGAISRVKMISRGIKVNESWSC